MKRQYSPQEKAYQTRQGKAIPISNIPLRLWYRRLRTPVDSQCIPTAPRPWSFIMMNKERNFSGTLPTNAFKPPERWWLLLFISWPTQGWLAVPMNAHKLFWIINEGVYTSYRSPERDLQGRNNCYCRYNHRNWRRWGAVIERASLGRWLRFVLLIAGDCGKISRGMKMWSQQYQTSILMKVSDLADWGAVRYHNHVSMIQERSGSMSEGTHIYSFTWGHRPTSP